MSFASFPQKSLPLTLRITEQSSTHDILASLRLVSLHSTQDKVIQTKRAGQYSCPHTPAESAPATFETAVSIASPIF
jgi:hypothetical protein